MNDDNSKKSPKKDLPTWEELRDRVDKLSKEFEEYRKERKEKCNQQKK